jgi:hypothetical protein
MYRQTDAVSRVPNLSTVSQALGTKTQDQWTVTQRLCIMHNWRFYQHQLQDSSHIPTTKTIITCRYDPTCQHCAAWFDTQKLPTCWQDVSDNSASSHLTALHTARFVRHPFLTSKNCQSAHRCNSATRGSAVINVVGFPFQRTLQLPTSAWMWPDSLRNLMQSKQFEASEDGRRHVAEGNRRWKTFLRVTRWGKAFW